MTLSPSLIRILGLFGFILFAVDLPETATLAFSFSVAKATIVEREETRWSHSLSYRYEVAGQLYEARKDYHFYEAPYLPKLGSANTVDIRYALSYPKWSTPKSWASLELGFCLLWLAGCVFLIVKPPLTRFARRRNGQNSGRRI